MRPLSAVRPESGKGCLGMEPCNFKLETPRGTLPIHSIYKSMEEAEADGWGLWFQHENYLVLGRDNRVGAVVLVNQQV